MEILKEAFFYELVNEDTVRCMLCPHFCVIKNGCYGLCRVRKNIDGKLFTLNYGKITSYAYDPVEKKPLYHFYPGYDIFSIGSFGCNLKCTFCQNWQIAHKTPQTIKVNSSSISRMGRRDNCIGIAYTYNEPSIWYEFVLDTAIEVYQSGINNVLVTNGFIGEEPLKKLLPYISAMNIDLKAFSKGYYGKICGGDIEPVLRTVEVANKHCLVELTTLVVENENDNMEQLEEMFKWIASIDREIPLHLTRYYPSYKMNNPPTKIETLIKAKEIAIKYLSYVYIGNIGGIDNNTYCPKCGNIIVERNLKIEALGIDDGKCNRCGYKIKIIL